MAGGTARNDAAITEALTAMAQVLAQAQGNLGYGQQDQREAEERMFDHFMRNHPPTFKGRHDPDGAQTWLQVVDRIFCAMVSSDDQKARMVTHMLAEEDEFWWTNAKRRLEAGGVVVTLERFKEEFLRKYFPTDLRNMKEVEFLQLKQGSMSVAKYAAKFEELSSFCPYINAEGAEVCKRVKFESNL